MLSVREPRRIPIRTMERLKNKNRKVRMFVFERNRSTSQIIQHALTNNAISSHPSLFQREKSKLDTTTGTCKSNVNKTECPQHIVHK